MVFLSDDLFKSNSFKFELLKRLISFSIYGWAGKLFIIRRINGPLQRRMQNLGWYFPPPLSFAQDLQYNYSIN